MSQLNRRSMLRVLLLTPLAALIAACRRDDGVTPVAQVPPTDPPTGPPTDAGGAAGSASTLEPTPACGDDDEATPPQTAGPFYTPDTPERTSFLEEGVEGTRLVVSGQVVSAGCTPVAGALLDFWHCDSAGVYDNEGYRLRGHQFADEQGRYSLETILPGVYPGRTRHIHVRVQGPDQPALTTQLYFPDEPENARDGIFDARLVMALADSAEGKRGVFDFVLAG